MVGELLIVQDMKTICYWANIVLAMAVCLSYFIYALVKEVFLRRRGRFTRLKWDETYFQRRSEILRDIKGFPEQEDPSEDGVGEETRNKPKRDGSFVLFIYP